MIRRTSSCWHAASAGPSIRRPIKSASVNCATALAPGSRPNDLRRSGAPAREPGTKLGAPHCRRARAWYRGPWHRAPLHSADAAVLASVAATDQDRHADDRPQPRSHRRARRSPPGPRPGPVRSVDHDANDGGAHWRPAIWRCLSATPRRAARDRIRSNVDRRPGRSLTRHRQRLRWPQPGYAHRRATRPDARTPVRRNGHEGADIGHLPSFVGRSPCVTRDFSATFPRLFRDLTAATTATQKAHERAIRDWPAQTAAKHRMSDRPT